MYPLFFRELEIHITEFRRFVRNTSTVRIRDEISVVNFETVFQTPYLSYSFFVPLVRGKACCLSPLRRSLDSEGRTSLGLDEGGRRGLLFLIKIKRCLVLKANQFFSSHRADHLILPLSFEDGLDTALREDENLSIAEYLRVRDIIVHCECHVHRHRPRRRRPREK